MYTIILLLFICLLLDNVDGKSCCYNTECQYTYLHAEEKCFMSAVYSNDLGEGYCMGGDCTPIIGSGKGKCYPKQSWKDGCVNDAAHVDNNYCVTGLCSTTTKKCEARDTETSCLPTPSPTPAPSPAPTPSPTPAPTPSPSPSPTPAPTLSPTDIPTIDPSNTPTDGPTQDPTHDPTMEPTNNPTIEPTCEQTVDPTVEATNRPNTSTQTQSIVTIFTKCGFVALCVCVIAFVIVLRRKGQKKKGIPSDLRMDLIERTCSVDDFLLEEFTIQNAMVILIAIGIYQENPDHPDEELKNIKMQNLHGIEKDVENLQRAFGKKVLNYTIYPHYKEDESPKLEWTQNEIMIFLEEQARFLENRLDTFDGLIVAISGHGMKGFICTSDSKMIQKTAIHRIFSQKHISLRNIPRIFMFDCCDGQFECSKGRKKQRLILRRESNDKDHGKKITLAEIEAENETPWKKKDKNPDYRLVEINAANRGFQSKLHTRKGSYMLSEFAEKIVENAKNNRHQYVFEIFDEIQQHLSERGKSLITFSYNNKTRYITFQRNEEYALLVNDDGDSDLKLENEESQNGEDSNDKEDDPEEEKENMDSDEDEKGKGVGNVIEYTL